MRPLIAIILWLLAIILAWYWYDWRLAVVVFLAMAALSVLHYGDV